MRNLTINKIFFSIVLTDVNYPERLVYALIHVDKNNLFLKILFKKLRNFNFIWRN